MTLVDVCVTVVVEAVVEVTVTLVDVCVIVVVLVVVVVGVVVGLDVAVVVSVVLVVGVVLGEVVAVVVADVVAVEVGVEVAVVVTDVVGVVISHPRNTPATYSFTAALSESRVAPQSLLSKKNAPKHPIVSSLPSTGPVTSFTTLLSAAAVSLHELAPALNDSRLSSPSASQTTSPASAVHADSTLFSQFASEAHLLPPKKLEPYLEMHSKPCSYGDDVGVVVAVVVAVVVVVSVVVRVVVSVVDGVVVGVVLGVLVSVDVAVVVSDVVGVVTSHPANPPASAAATIAFTVSAVSVQPVLSRKYLLNAHSASSAAPPSGPRNSETA